MTILCTSASVAPAQVIHLVYPDNTIYWYAAGTPLSFPVYISPEIKRPTALGAVLRELDWESGLFELFIESVVVGESIIIVQGHSDDGEVDVEEVRLIVHEPQLILSERPLALTRATVGEVYNPSTSWAAMQIPEAHYATVVSVNGTEVFNRIGTRFSEDELPDVMMVREKMEIRTIVYWRPLGTSDPSRWVPIFSTDPEIPAPVMSGPVVVSEEVDE